TKDDVRRRAALQTLELLLDAGRLRGEEPVAESLRRDSQGARAFGESAGALPRLAHANRGAAEDDPVDFGRAPLQEMKERPPAADLDVVRVRPETKDAKRFFGPARNLET